MQIHNKRDLILDAMQDLMNAAPNSSISVSDIAKKAGIGKGSVYYYFNSKNDIIEAVIERSYAIAIEKSKEMVSSPDLDAFTKMEILFRTCMEASSELKRQEESSSFIEIQQSALTHQKFVSFLVKSLKPILSDIIRQGNNEGTISCDYPEDIAEIVLLVLIVKFDNHILPSSPQEIKQLLYAFSTMQSKSMGIDINQLHFLYS